MVEEQRNGRTINRPQKVGLAPITREGAEYEFDILMDMDKGCGYIDHTSRCAALQNMVIQHPGAELAKMIKSWLDGDDQGARVQKEEKFAKTKHDPPPSMNESGPRPGVPVAEAAKGKPAGPKPATASSTTSAATNGATSNQSPVGSPAPTQKNGDTNQKPAETASPSDEDKPITKDQTNGFLAYIATQGWSADQAISYCIEAFKLDESKPVSEQLKKSQLMKAWEHISANPIKESIAK